MGFFILNVSVIFESLRKTDRIGGTVKDAYLIDCVDLYL